MGFALAAPLGLSACQATYRNHGYVPPEEQLAQVVVGQTTQADIEGLLGRPSAQGLLTGSAWYYVGSRWQFYGPREPREIDRQVVAVSFAENGVVSNVERFGLERGQVVVLSRRVTDAGVSSLGLIRQLLGNVGRVQASDFLRD
ncbi:MULTISPECIES: outer membrane protein assembly factor BamE [Paracoccus]|uniref:Outer membrane protein assembly factor BamE n=2 Tax=Paracoccus TaxID=265 RepID=A0AAD3RT06_9RHOB|nr:outer membrane protein assembly factor BamE [Paracoccus kondratievae]SMG06365.1 Beta-barrel assembly machine subunit BamE [Paracoccus sp. J56]